MYVKLSNLGLSAKGFTFVSYPYSYIMFSPNQNTQQEQLRYLPISNISKDLE